MTEVGINEQSHLKNKGYSFREALLNGTPPEEVLARLLRKGIRRHWWTPEHVRQATTMLFESDKSTSSPLLKTYYDLSYNTSNQRVFCC